jgi:hypothetical protein
MKGGIKINNMESRFKVGDTVRRARGGSNDGVLVGDICKIVEMTNSGNDIRLNVGTYKNFHAAINFDLVEEKTLSKPILHIVLNDVCNNFISIHNTYEDAVTKSVPMGNIYKVYKLVPVARLENETKVTPITSPRQRTKKSKK